MCLLLLVQNGLNFWIDLWCQRSWKLFGLSPWIVSVVRPGVDLKKRNNAFKIRWIEIKIRIFIFYWEKTWGTWQIYSQAMLRSINCSGGDGRGRGCTVWGWTEWYFSITQKDRNIFRLSFQGLDDFFYF